MNVDAKHESRERMQRRRYAAEERGDMQTCLRREGKKSPEKVKLPRETHKRNPGEPKMKKKTRPKKFKNEAKIQHPKMKRQTNSETKSASSRSFKSS